MKLLELVKMTDTERNSSWETQFFQALTESKLNLISAEPQTGPDGWPYLLVETDANAQEPAQNIVRWLSEKGIGLAVNPRKEYPDYVFTYGMLWSFKETGYFFRPTQDKDNGQVQFDTDALVHAGSPTEEYLPTYVRKVLTDFFRDQGLLRVKILLISTDRLNYDLAISLESLGSPPESEHAGIAEAIGWFLPPHYSLILVSEKGLPSFFDL